MNNPVRPSTMANLYLKTGLAAVLAGVVTASIAVAAPSKKSSSKSSSLPSGVAQVGTMSHPRLIESSGVVPSTTDTNLFWTHNDGDQPVLFGIRRSGEPVAEFAISGVPVADWEDIARDNDGHLYLADIGNNNLQRSEVAVHQFDEPRAGERSGTLQVKQSWRLRFPEKPFNCETLFIWNGHGYLVSKVTKKEVAVLYRFPLTAPNGPVTLERVTELAVNSPVTGGDLSSDAKRLVLVAKAGIFLFDLGGDPADAGKALPKFLKFKEGQVEGCCFVPEGILAVSEKREVFCFHPEALTP
jgi:hypothetical protein